MKKKVLCLLLALCLTAMIVPVLSVGARADGDTVAYYLAPYVMGKGDTVAGVCKMLGIDFNGNEKLIKTFNHITNYSKIPAGSTIFLPVMMKPASGDYYEIVKHTVVSGDTMYKLCKGYGVSYSSVTDLLKVLNSTSDLGRIYKGQLVYIPVFHGTGSGTGGGSSTEPGKDLPVYPEVTDGTAYYMVPHTMIKGETIAEVCKSNGVAFKSFEAAIKAFNNIKDCAKVYAGTTIYLPTVTKPAGGNYYSVMFHVVASGDTVYKLCKLNGVDYSKNLSLLKVLNNTNNLGRIVVGQPVYIPVFHSDGTGTGTGSGTGTADPDAINIRMTLSAPIKAADAKAAVSGKGDNVIYYMTYTQKDGTLTLKTVTAVPTASEYFMVVAHKVVSGDTVYKLCKAYGIDYARNLDLMRSINKQLNLNMIYKDDYVLLPILVTTK